MSGGSPSRTEEIAAWLVFSDEAQPVREMVKRDTAVYVAKFGHAPSSSWMAKRAQAAVRTCVDCGDLQVDE